MTKQKKDGFTLIELLGILVLLTIISLISFKVIDSSLKKGKTDAYEKQLKMIELAAKNYMTDYSDKLPDVGSKTYVTLGFLKIFGYSEMKVVNPKSNKCFSNDLTIAVSKPKSDVDYVYEIDRNTIKEVDDCSITDVSLEEPTVSISGGAEYINQSGGRVSYIVAYNKSVSDTLADSYIKYYDSALATSSEFKINEEKQVSNGYSREVIINYKGGYPEGEKFYVEVLEGLVTIGNKKSPYIKSIDTIVSGTPNIQIEDLGIVSGGELVTGNQPRFVKLNEEGYYDTWNSNACFNGKYAFNQAINVKVTNKDYIKYTLYNGSHIVSDNIINSYEKEGSDEFITIFAAKNGNYTLTACDSVHACSSTTIKFGRNDCLAPILDEEKTLDNNSNGIIIDDFFRDNIDDGDNADSGIGDIYVFVHPYQGLATYSEMIEIPNTGIYSPYYMINSTGGVAISKTNNTNFDIDNYNFANSNITLKEIVSMAGKQNIFCGNYYLYFLVTDRTTPKNVNLFSFSTSFEGKECPTGTVFIPSQETDTCDTICQMQKNSGLWHSADENGRNELHQKNIKLAYEAFGKNAYYNENTGIWNYCNDGICKELYTDAYVNLEDAGSSINPPTN